MFCNAGLFTKSAEIYSRTLVALARTYNALFSIVRNLRIFLQKRLSNFAEVLRKCQGEQSKLHLLFNLLFNHQTRSRGTAGCFFSLVLRRSNFQEYKMPELISAASYSLKESSMLA